MAGILKTIRAPNKQRFLEIMLKARKIKMLRPQSQTGKVCRERLPKFALGSLGKRSMERWERSAH